METVCVVGCGQGDRVAELRDGGHDAYGVDIDHRALAAADPQIMPFLRSIDAERRTDWEWFTESIGIDTFDMIITERCVSCFDRPEDTCALLREYADTVRHEVAAIAPADDPTETPLTPDEWRSRCDPRGEDEWVDAMR